MGQYNLLSGIECCEVFEPATIRVHRFNVSTNSGIMSRQIQLAPSGLPRIQALLFDMDGVSDPVQSDTNI